MRRQRLEDERANYRALRAFLDAKYRLAKVDIWLDTRVTELHAQADARRTAHRLAVANALADMTARGMTVNEIARMAGIEPEVVQNFLERTA